ncbi:hypothetical protein [Archangium violaceum]|uniref:Uncharacterized protein n=1 Tax=Archangium violaceum Cb vi76 TaxID=1406225 RepID=A0A084SGU6_9BACT|nr:hypothetical protein [Archangium violaceum]KFA87681.1 hypothetical protein Q664_46185 [Archangium violaceum Cb vi76]
MNRREKMPRFDRAKVRAHAHNLDGTGLRVWLDRAIGLLPDEAFPELIANYVRLEDVVADGRAEPGLLHSIRRFHHESLAGRYYQDFMVSSRNFMEKSHGTETFIAEHSRLLDACMRAERAGEIDTAREGLGLLIDLMRQIDRCEVNIIFFADEAGSWQVGVDWAEVLPAWFRSLSPATGPYDWAEAVVEALNDFAGYQMDPLLAATRDIATPEQREALAEYEGNLRRRR